MQRISMVGGLSGFLLLTGALWVVGCRPAAPETKAPPQNQAPAPDAKKQEALRLLNRQIEINDKMTALYAAVTTKEAFEQAIPEIKKLKSDLSKVMQQFNDLPADLKKEAQAELGAQVRQSEGKFFKAKENAHKFK